MNIRNIAPFALRQQAKELLGIGPLQRDLADVRKCLADIREHLEGHPSVVTKAEPVPAPTLHLHPSDCDIGRIYLDPDTANPMVTLTHGDPVPWSPAPTDFTIRSGGEQITRTVYHPHLCLLKVIKDYPIKNVMDVGCGDGHEADLFRFLGSTVFTVNADPAPSFTVDYFGDYMNLRAPRQFDLIWCSNVLEHVRNPGAFIDKLYDDLEPGGALALSVPYNEFNSGPDAITIGHHNRYSFLLLVYQLICAGFDCTSPYLAMRIYNGQISIIVRKQPNGIERNNMAVYATALPFFPVEITSSGASCDLHELNWDSFFVGGPTIEYDASINWRRAAPTS